MPVTERKMNFNDGSNDVEVYLPEWGYNTTIALPFDIQKLSAGSGYDVYDHGATYDIRSCDCNLVLSATEMNSLNDIMYAEAKGRGKDVTLTMAAGSGFFPFGPDKGDVGAFTVSCVITTSEAIGDAPYQYFRVGMRLTNTGSWPGYSAPAEVDEGPFGVGTVTNCRFPQQWFSPSVGRGVYAAILQNADAEYIDRGINADDWEASFQFESNESKAAAVIDYLLTVRSGAFDLVCPSNSYPFGREKGTGGTYSVRLIQDSIMITHIQHDQFQFGMNVSYISGPA